MIGMIEKDKSGTNHPPPLHSTPSTTGSTPSGHCLAADFSTTPGVSIKPCGFTLVGEPWRRMGRPLKDLEGFNIACKILDLDTCTGYWKYASKKPGIPTHHCNMFQTLLLGGSTALLDTPNKIFCVERMKLANIESLVVHRIILQSWAFHPKFLNLYWVWLKEIKKKTVLVHTRLRSDQGFVASPFPAAP